MIVSLRDPEYGDALAEVALGERLGVERDTVLSLIAALVESMAQDHEKIFTDNEADFEDAIGRLERESLLLARLVEQVAISGSGGWSALTEEGRKPIYGPYPERRAAEEAARERNTAYKALRATLGAAREAYYDARTHGQDAQTTASATTGDDTGNTATAKE